VILARHGFSAGGSDMASSLSSCLKLLAA